MTDDLDGLPTGTIDALRAAGARFALLHGSRASGSHRSDSDIDVAAWWAEGPPPAFEVDVPAGVDLLVLNDAPLELAGRVAQDGVLIFDDDPPARVRWQADTRLQYLDDLPAVESRYREFVSRLAARAVRG